MCLANGSKYKAGLKLSEEEMKDVALISELLFDQMTKQFKIK